MLKLISVLCKCIFRSKPTIAKSIDEIKVTVDKAIENKDPREIDTIIEQRDLRIAQKYIDQLISNKGLDVSFESYLGGVFGLIAAFFAIGITYILTDQSTKATGLASKGLIIAIFAIGFGSFVVIKIHRSNEKIKKEIKFMQGLVLKIEERLEK